MKRRRSEEDDSSLELLLDTMCNTFGGVMFIAISVFVLLSAMSQDPASKMQEKSSDPAALRKEITQLQTLLEKIRNDIQLKSQLLQIKQTAQENPRLQEIMIMQQMVKENNLKISAAAIESKLLRREKTELIKQQLDQQKILSLKMQELRNLEVIELDTARKLDKIMQQNILQRTLTFKLIRPGSKAPFFLMVSNNEVYPVGPWQKKGAKDQIDPAVTHKNYSRNNISAVECNIIPGKGITITQNGKITPEFLGLLNRLPADRVPKFFITPNSAKSVFVMRSYLKKHNIEHGCTLAARDDEPFFFQYSQQADYEY